MRSWEEIKQPPEGCLLSLCLGLELMLSVASSPGRAKNNLHKTGKRSSETLG